MRSTYTYAVLDISAEAYAEIRAKLEAAGYEHAFHQGRDLREVIDMHGIAVAAGCTQTADACPRQPEPDDIEMIPVESSNIASVAWRATPIDRIFTGFLRVAFKNGSVYEYAGVSWPLFVNLLNGKSKGRALAAIKASPKAYPCRKVESARP